MLLSCFLEEEIEKTIFILIICHCPRGSIWRADSLAKIPRNLEAIFLEESRKYTKFENICKKKQVGDRMLGQGRCNSSRHATLLYTAGFR